jgi:hypothetical protein
MSNFENKGQKWKLTTGQISGITLLGSSSLYRYVRDFPEFFSPTAKQHIKGRRWTQEDLEKLQAIRCLYHERTGKEKIRELIVGGWRLQDNEAWTRELQSRLIESTLATYAEMEEISKQAIKAVNEAMEELRTLEYNDKIFRELVVKVWDLEEEWKYFEKGLILRGIVRDARKRGYWIYPEGLHLVAHKPKNY